MAVIVLKSISSFSYSILISTQPQLFIDPDFWDDFSKNDFFQCDHRAQCEDKECLGLNSAYIKIRQGVALAESYP